MFKDFRKNIWTFLHGGTRNDPRRHIDPPETSSGAEGEPATKGKPEARKRWDGEDPS